MNNSYDSFTTFIGRLIAASPIIADAHRRSVDYWSPDAVPETIALYNIGNTFIDNFGSFSDYEMNEITAIIEQGVTSSVFEFRNTVIVGLVDAIASAAVNTDGKDNEIFDRLLGATRSYALQWVKDGKK